jgi:uncharacterized membrane protein YozB (DUF420 family)
MSYENLPTLNAFLNGTSAVLIVVGYVCIRRGLRKAHMACMLSAVGVSAAFLTSYLVYHFGPLEEARFEGTGILRVAYLSMLASHVILAIAVVPLVAVTVVRALRGRLERHVKIARVTIWIWLYVSITGILVYVALYETGLGKRPDPDTDHTQRSSISAPNSIGR